MKNCVKHISEVYIGDYMKETFEALQNSSSGLFCVTFSIWRKVALKNLRKAIEANSTKILESDLMCEFTKVVDQKMAT